MAVSQPPSGRFTYADLEAIPEDMVIRSIIDGELFVSPSPERRHQKAVINIAFRLKLFANETGGEVYTGPFGVYYTDTNYLEPDLVYIRSDHLDRLNRKHLAGSPDLAIEVSSPSTRRVDRIRKREIYERFGVPEFWFVDLENNLVEVFVLSEGAYGPPVTKHPGDLLEPAGLTGLSVPVTEALAADPT